MPTLIRLVVFLLFLAGLVFAAMFALTVFVDPGEKEITIRIPARDLQVEPVRPAPLTVSPEPTTPAAAEDEGAPE